MKSLFATLTLLALLASTSLNARILNKETGIYTGIDTGLLFYKQDLGSGVGDVSYTIPTVQARLGYEFNKYFSLETRAMTGLDEDDDTVSGVKLKVDWEYTFSAYLKGAYPIEEYASIYALAGVAHSKIEATASSGSLSASVDDSETDFSFGAGLSIALDERWDASIEWLWLHNAFDKDAGEVGQANLGLTYLW